MDTTTERKVKQTARETTERVEASASKAAEGLRDYQTAMLSRSLGGAAMPATLLALRTMRW